MDAIAADFVILDSEQVLGPGWVGFQDGRIVEIAEGKPPSDLRVEMGGHGSIIMPGLICAHTHLPLGNLRHVADDRGFLDWILRGILPALGEIENQPGEFLAGAIRSAHALLEGGVTFVADSFLRAEGIEAMRQTGLRGLFFQEVFGSLASDDAAYIAQTSAELDELPTITEGFPFAYAPHTPWTCPPKVMTWIAERAKQENRRLSIHLDESVEEHEFFLHQRGPLHEIVAKRDALHRYDLGMSPTASLHQSGALGANTLAIHCVQVGTEDIKLLAETGTHVVHCPRSNLKLAEGFAPIAELVEAGVNVAIGTDSIASNGALDLFEEMRTSLLVERGRLRGIGTATAQRAFAMATVGGARALGVDHQVGRLAKGMDADLVMLQLDRVRHGPLNDPVAAVVWTAQTDDVVLVLGQGHVRHRVAGRI